MNRPQRGETNLPGVYAVGDAASWWYEAAGGHRRVKHWTTAVDQASVVAHNIAVPEAPQVAGRHFPCPPVNSG